MKRSALGDAGALSWAGEVAARPARSGLVNSNAATTIVDHATIVRVCVWIGVLNSYNLLAQSALRSS